MQKQVRRIVEDYFKLKEFAYENNFEMDELYDHWVEQMAKYLNKHFKKRMRRTTSDLLELCEDNEVLTTAIKDYFCARKVLICEKDCDNV